MRSTTSCARVCPLWLSCARTASFIQVFMCAVALLGLCGLPQASAQEAAAASSTEAREAFRRGEAAYSAGNYESAIREWNAAYQADARPRIQFNLSQAYERLGQLENAINALERFLESGDPEDSNYSDANARLVALRQRLASTGVKVNGGSEGGLILVDEQDWGRTPRPDKITVAPGNHALTVRWPDGRVFRTSVFVPAGQVVDVAIHEPGPAATTTASSDATAKVQSAPGTATPPDRRILWYSLGGSLAAVGTGLIIYGGVRKAATGDCSDSTEVGSIYCDPDDRDAADRQSVVGFAAGGVTLATGVVLIVVGAVTHRKKSDQQAKTQCGFGFASATCRVRF